MDIAAGRKAVKALAAAAVSPLEWEISLLRIHDGHIARINAVKANGILPAVKSGAILSAVRVERDKRLTAVDYMAMPDYPNKSVGLNAYRQALRDFPATVNVSALPWPLDVAALPWPKL